MKKFISVVLLAVISVSAAAAYADYQKFDIKYFMHEEIVNERYGDPIGVKKIKINPIPVKEALYRIDDSNYMILKFFSGRIWKITLLEGMDLAQAESILRND